MEPLIPKSSRLVHATVDLGGKDPTKQQNFESDFQKNDGDLNFHRYLVVKS